LVRNLQLLTEQQKGSTVPRQTPPERPQERPKEPAKDDSQANKAKLEFEAYKKRLEGAGDAATGTSFGQRIAPVPHMAVPAWPWPMGPGGYGPGASSWGPHPSVSPANDSSDSLADRLSVTVKLGMDLLNAGLAGGSRLLQGLSAMGAQYGYAYGGYHGHGCSCQSCCGEDYGCCQVDCCHLCGASDDCTPSVGSCC
jgi:hypothetical protein